MSSNDGGVPPLARTPKAAPRKKSVWDSPEFAERLRKRYAVERRFRFFGVCSLVAGVLFLATLLSSIVGTGYSAFFQTYMAIDVTFDESVIDPQGTRDPKVLRTADYGGLVKKTLRDHFPEVSGRRAKRKLYRFVSNGAQFQLAEMVT